MNQSDAIDFLRNLDRQLEHVDRAYEEGRWLKNQGLLSPEAQNDLEAQRANLLLNEHASAAAAEVMNTVADPFLRRMATVFDRSIRAARVESNQAVYALRTRIEQAVINYPITVDGRSVTRTDLKQILRTEPDGEVRREAWLAMAGLSRLVEADVIELVSRRNALARDLGYAHYGDLGLALQVLVWDPLRAWFDRIVESTGAAHARFLERGADCLRQPVLYPWDLDYAASRLTTLADKYFPRDELLTSVRWLAERLDLGDAVGGIRTDFVDIPWGGLCVTVHAPDDVRILMNPSDGHRYYETLFHEYGHGLHSRRVGQPVHVFRDEPGPFCEGMACTLARFADEPDFLASRSGLAATALREHRLGWRDQMSLHLRRLIGQARFEYSLYTDPQARLLEVFRTSMSDSLGVSFEAAQAWADNLYWTSYPLYVQNYVVAELITSQTHAALRRELGATIHPVTGAWLTRHYWAQGGSVEWPEKVAQATGTPLAPDQLIRELTGGFPTA